LTFTFSAILLDPDLLDRFCLSGNRQSTAGVLHAISHLVAASKYGDGPHNGAMRSRHIRQVEFDALEATKVMPLYDQFSFATRRF
jgi:hypothetical protein